MRQPQPPSDSPRLLDKGENIATALARMPESQRAEVVRAMQRIVPGLGDVRANAAGRYLTLVFTQRHGAERQAEFEATEMSDGALRALAIFVVAQQIRPNELLVIEEPEVSLHPGAADVVYDVLHRASKHGTVLVTTHSPEILDRAKDDEILVCEYVKGVTKLGPLAESQRALVRQGLFSAAELMRSEELRREGAEPRVVQGA
jgi:type I restriction enzyme M protein